MSFGQAVKSVFSQYATFRGRARRAEYWWFYLFSLLVSLPFQILFFVMYMAAFAPVFEQVDASGNVPDSALEEVNWGLFGGALIPLMILGLVLFLPTLAVMVRRLHDTGRSGWWYLISFVPGGNIVLLIFAVLEGQPYENQYGPDPKAAERYMGPGYGQPQQYAQPGMPQQYGQPPAPSFPPPPPAPDFPPQAQPPINPDDPFATPGR